VIIFKFGFLFLLPQNVRLQKKRIARLNALC
jgi:hypothetical protein